MYVNKVDVTFPARIEPFSAADGRRTWDMCAQFIVCFCTGVVCGREICDGSFRASRPHFVVNSEETVVGGDQHRGDTDMIEPSMSFHGQSHRLARREDCS